MSTLFGTYQQRISQDTSVLPERQWWQQTDDGPEIVPGQSIAPRGYYLWENGTWGYFPEAGKDQFGQVLIEGADYPPLRARRLTNKVAGGRNSIATVARTSGDMLDAFGGGMRFGIQDGSMSEPSDIGEVGATRNGADNRGRAYLAAFGGGLGDGSVSLDHNGVLEHTFRGSANGKLYSMVKKFMQVFSVAVANTVTETTLFSVINGYGTLTFPANFFFETGRPIQGKLRGAFSTTGTPTLQIKVKLGDVTVLNTGAVTLAGTISGKYWEFDFGLMCVAIGVSGVFAGAGKFTYDNAAHNATPFGAVNTAGAIVDTTAEQALDVTVTWGAASPSNTITATEGAIEVAK